MKFYQTINNKNQEVIVRVVTRKGNTNVLILYTLETNEISTIELLPTQNLDSLIIANPTEALLKIKKVEKHLNLEVFQTEKYSKVPIDLSN